MESVLRKEDIRLADLISMFLDKHFYDKYTTDFERVTDKKRQCQGIDTIFNIGKKKYVCDEKNGGTRINTNLTTFSLELSFIDRAGERQVGWLLNDDNVNDSYLFIWTDKADSVKPTSVSEIHKVEIALVKKEAIKTYLKSVGLDNMTLLAVSESIVNHPENMQYALTSSYDGKYKYSINGVNFCHSTQLYEQPVNIILPRRVYRELSDFNTILRA